jgi:signal transduction histidine kinase
MGNFSNNRPLTACCPTKSACVILCLILSLWVRPCLSQEELPSVKEWKAIAAAHQARKLNDTLYLHQAQLLTERSFTDPSLKEKLVLYREIAWSDTAYQRFRVKYFAFLANQTAKLHQEGFSIYYLEKMEEELQKVKPYVNSLNQPRLLLGIYGENNNTNFEKRIAIIDSVMPFLKSLPKIVSRQPVSINTCINAFNILKHASQLYLVMKDTVHVLAVADLSQKLWNHVENKGGFDNGKMQQCRFAMQLTESVAARILSEPGRESKILTTVYQDITAPENKVSALFKRPMERTILGKLIDFYIFKNQVDSVNYYFGQFKNKVASYSKSEAGDGTKFLIYSGKVYALNNDYKTAYQRILRAYEINDSIISIKMSDIQNNMYAHLIAEQRSEALIVAEREKSERNMLIIIIASLFVISVIGFLWRARAASAKAGKQIEELNKVTQIQIAELETAANLAQKRMGMELHDDIAGRLVNVCNFVETRTFDEKDPERRKVFSQIGEMVRDAYTSTRLKSHEWYFTGEKGEQTVFSQRVAKIIEQALPDGKYDKQIEIDDDSLVKMSPEIRINLLRIIQEVMANILKHAKASRVKLFLYQEDDSLALQISDNGKGFDPDSNFEGFGLKSLRSRVAEMRGSLQITSSRNGTELSLTIPVSDH